MKMTWELKKATWKWKQKRQSNSQCQQLNPTTYHISLWFTETMKHLYLLLSFKWTKIKFVQFWSPNTPNNVTVKKLWLTKETLSSLYANFNMNKNLHSIWTVLKPFCWYGINSALLSRSVYTDIKESETQDLNKNHLSYACTSFYICLFDRSLFKMVN